MNTPRKLATILAVDVMGLLVADPGLDEEGPAQVLRKLRRRLIDLVDEVIQ